MGTVNPLGSDVAAYWKALCAGQSGISRIEQFDVSAFKVHFGGEVKNFNPEEILDSKAARRLDRFAQFGVVASILAVKDSGIDFAKEDPFRCGVIIGSGIGGLNEFEEQHTRLMEKGPDRLGPFMIPKMISNAASANVSIHFGLRGPNTSVATACTSAANSVSDALRAIQWGYADVMVTGGTEAAMTPMGLGGFIAAKALSHRNEDPKGASRPWDKDRDGFVLSEGAGIIVLEEFERAKKRGATIFAEVLGAGSTADAHHITAPHPDGDGAVHAMKFALQDSKLNPEDIGYINAHGTSTQLGDAAETNAIKKVFAAHARNIPVSSTKSMIGHLLGASGGVELIATVMSLKTGILHPTINLHTPDPTCDLDYVPNTAREVRIRRALSNSFGFGGHNCTLVVGSV